MYEGGYVHSDLENHGFVEMGGGVRNAGSWRDWESLEYVLKGVLQLFGWLLSG